MDDLRIGQRPDKPPQKTVSGGAIRPGADFVNLGGEYYGRLDLPHHSETNKFVSELREIVTNLDKPKRRAKAVDTDEADS